MATSKAQMLAWYHDFTIRHLRDAGGLEAHLRDVIHAQDVTLFTRQQLFVLWFPLGIRAVNVPLQPTTPHVTR